MRPLEIGHAASLLDFGHPRHSPPYDGDSFAKLVFEFVSDFHSDDGAVTIFEKSLDFRASNNSLAVHFIVIFLWSIDENTSISTSEPLNDMRLIRYSGIFIFRVRYVERVELREKLETYLCYGKSRKLHS